ncbi:hypothetical protein ACX3VT_00890 [Aerococcus sanguinicola]|uniref:hypothetical protein n=1 Tax=unclassified Aerococcus TaxID=2618060 RepID=UPI0008A57455|nr:MULTISPECIES: hypothetical protein [unclassified Aerococcus]KAB0646208.1 hypothetical protein F6I01_07870 [Aerococcus sanguinicola]MDK6234102.1 hypothetical protein [Aerococcus sp. UMB10185]MDK6856284.1 hypothetical protein [Aerococcus sp. UMB7533]MDK8503239.1 hypothetical protein [Aerococcus sp. UMB1112A]OFN01151.1 hypothetical protein HMPREF2626_02795 [Aerococcus sp. HMSC062A02]
MKKNKKKKFNWQRVLVVAVSLFLIGGVGVYAALQQEPVQTAIEDHKESGAEKAVADLYFDEAKMFLAEDISQEDIEAAKEDVANLKDEEGIKGQLQGDLEDVQNRYDVQNATNNLFEKTKDKQPLNGATLQKWVIIKDGLKKADVDKVKNQHKAALESKEDGLYGTLADLVKTAEEQADKFEKFTKTLNDLKSAKSLKQEDLQKELDKLREEAEKEENPYVTAKMLDMISQVDEDLTERISQAEIDQARKSGASQDQIKKLEEEAKKAQDQARERSDRLQKQANEARQQATQSNRNQSQNVGNRGSQRVTPPSSRPASNNNNANNNNNRQNQNNNNDKKDDKKAENSKASNNQQNNASSNNNAGKKEEAKPSTDSSAVSSKPLNENQGSANPSTAPSSSASQGGATTPQTPPEGQPEAPAPNDTPANTGSNAGADQGGAASGGSPEAGAAS